MKKLNDAVAYNLFQYEVNRLKKITYKGYRKTLDEIGVSYLAQCNCSTKLHHNGKLNMLTYGLYLASADASGFNVCPKCDMCRESCLVEFSVRLNCTSDISPLAFVLDGKNILEIFPNVSFYDYTKVKSRWEVAERYENYYITYSRDGSVENEEECLEWLRRGNNVAVVFGVTKPSELPKKWKGYEVLVGDDYDYRVWDKLQVGKQIVGLVYKVGKNDFDVVNGKHVFRGIPNSPFIISPNDRDCEF